MTKFLFPDNSVIVSFAHANELQVLREYLRDRARVVEAVSHEIQKSSERVPHMAQINQNDWFGDPIEITRTSSIASVEKMRVAVFGGTRAKPTQHLGESQTLHLLKNEPEYQDSFWLTEDRSAYLFAEQQHIAVRDIFGLLHDMVGITDLTAHRAHEVCTAILEAGRSLRRVPESPRDFTS